MLPQPHHSEAKWRPEVWRLIGNSICQSLHSSSLLLEIADIHRGVAVNDLMVTAGWLFANGLVLCFKTSLQKPNRLKWGVSTLPFPCVIVLHWVILSIATINSIRYMNAGASRMKCAWLHLSGDSVHGFTSLSKQRNTIYSGFVLHGAQGSAAQGWLLEGVKFTAIHSRETGADPKLFWTGFFPPHIWFPPLKEAAFDWTHGPILRGQYNGSFCFVSLNPLSMLHCPV